jgi:RNA-directed DNA polymerase
MNLKDDKQQNIQMQLDFSSALTGEAREAGREETESAGAMHGTENPAGTNRLMEEVCERENLKAALRRVKANKGSPGVDGMTVIGIKDYLKQHWPAIREQLLSGTYEPKPVRRVEIAKPDGGVRKLGIPTVLDRFIQQAVMQVLQRRWDRTFSDHSYGFRPGRSAQQAVAQAQQYIAEGHGWCVDLDLEKFFDWGQPRQIDGSDRQTGRGQAAAETHPGILECWGDGERVGQPERGRDSARRSTFATAE